MNIYEFPFVAFFVACLNLVYIPNRGSHIDAYVTFSFPTVHSDWFIFSQKMISVLCHLLVNEVLFWWGETAPPFQNGRHCCGQIPAVCDMNKVRGKGRLSSLSQTDPKIKWNLPFLKIYLRNKQRKYCFTSKNITDVKTN